MARVTEDEVLALFDPEPEIDMTGSIATANLLVTEELAGQGLSDSRLKQIELYLAAHFASLILEKGPVASVSLGDAKDAYHNVYKGGIASTRFGQQALTLDPTGILSNLSAKASNPMLQAQFRVV